MLRSSFYWVPMALGVMLFVGLPSALPQGPAAQRGERVEQVRPGREALRLLSALRSWQVQKEVKLSAEQRQKIEQSYDDLARGRMSMAEILEPAQLKRLKELYLQSQGIAALRLPEVIESLGITDEQRQKISALQEQARARRVTALPGPSDQTPEERQREMDERQKQMREAKQKLLDDALQVLTPEQRKKFEEMTGKPLGFGSSSARPPQGLIEKGSLRKKEAQK
jgi:Spy/CpxP family protein refolding chaperone